MLELETVDPPVLIESNDFLFGDLHYVISGELDYFKMYFSEIDPIFNHKGLFGFDEAN